MKMKITPHIKVGMKLETPLEKSSRIRRLYSHLYSTRPKCLKSLNSADSRFVLLTPDLSHSTRVKDQGSELLSSKHDFLIQNLGLRSRVCEFFSELTTNPLTPFLQLRKGELIFFLLLLFKKEKRSSGCNQWSIFYGPK